MMRWPNWKSDDSEEIIWEKCFQVNKSAEEVIIGSWSHVASRWKPRIVSLEKEVVE